jgi:hypothetical protein
MQLTRRGRQPRGLVCSSDEFRLHLSPLVAYTLTFGRNMKIPLAILSVTLLSGCSCAITSISYSPVNRRPSIEKMGKLASDSGFRNYHNESNRRSYRNGVLGMHLTEPSGDLEFVNSHCPMLPFWVQPGRAFDKRWDDMSKMLKTLESAGFPYRLDTQAEQAGPSNGG